MTGLSRSPLHFLIPADWLLVQIDVDLFGFEVFFDAPGTQFTTEARLFVAAPRGFDIRRLHVIHPDDARAQGFHGTHRLENIAGPDSGGQAVGRIIGDLERVFFVLEWNHGCDRAEDFFAGDAGRVADVGEDRGLDVITFTDFLGASAAGS